MTAWLTPTPLEAKATEKAVTVFYIDLKPNQYDNVRTLQGAAPQLEADAPQLKPKPAKRSLRNVEGQGGRDSSPSPCSCVLAAKYWTGYSKSVGNARNWPKNSREPVTGGVVVTSESRWGHVAYILRVEDSRLYVREGNYSRCRITERWISINSPAILGFWTP